MFFTDVLDSDETSVVAPIGESDRSSLTISVVTWQQVPQSSPSINNLSEKLCSTRVAVKYFSSYPNPMELSQLQFTVSDVVPQVTESRSEN